jgi:hypothetical protein
MSKKQSVRIIISHRDMGGEAGGFYSSCSKKKYNIKNSCIVILGFEIKQGTTYVTLKDDGLGSR